MNTKYRKMKNLFLRQSYLDSWDDYIRSLRKSNFIKWDYIILTASNEEQAEVYRQQINARLENHLLPDTTRYVVLPDPDGKRVGSGGATFNVLRYIAQVDGEVRENYFAGKRILVIHSGGDSKRVPQYSACGKLFSPVPRELPNGRPSTLFDEFIIGMSGIPSRFKEGMLVLSGDVLLLFNPLQIDFQYNGAAAISIKEPVETGKNHGVFLNDGTDYVGRFLHKQSEEQLKHMGAVNDHGYVDLDTGAVIMDSQMLQALFRLISTDNKVDDTKFHKFVNEKSRISFYGDFLFPLAKESTLEEYYKEAPEGSFCEELTDCRTKIWENLHNFSMKLLCVSPAEFIHFGTTRELLNLVTSTIDDYEFLDWKRQVVTNVCDNREFASHNSFISDLAKVGEGSYIEDSYLLDGTVIGEHCIISNVSIKNMQIPSSVVMHGLLMPQGKCVVRTYAVEDNPKGMLSADTVFLKTTLSGFMEKNHLCQEDLWVGDDTYLWFAKLYPLCNTMSDALKHTGILIKMAEGTASAEEINNWKNSDRTSLYSSFNEADVQAIVPWKRELENQILVKKFITRVEKGDYYQDALQVFGDAGINADQYHLLMEAAKNSEFSTRIRIYYDLSRFMKREHCVFEGNSYDKLESLCFQTIQDVIYENGASMIKKDNSFKIALDEVNVALPVRVNWGGGWTDTPPHCNERGGVVLNAAIKLKGILPVQVCVRRLDELHVEFESEDIGVFGTVETVQEIQNCHDPFDSFALHKAALIACGIIPIEGDYDLKEILKNLGGGIYLSTQVKGVPKGSGLGTSSILSGACVKGIFDFLGQDISDGELYEIVLCMEQIMSTGGGWQDQVGGITPGIKYITTEPGISQEINVNTMKLKPEVLQELQDRFALIYTGQRRLARNLLRDVVGGYLGGRPESVEALHKMSRMAALMKFELERGDIEEFCRLLNEHWELSKKLDSGSTNTCIDQIFMACEDLIDARFISGAGGGGFLQVILKKGIKRDQLRQRLYGVFQDSGVDVWDCEILV